MEKTKIQLDLSFSFAGVSKKWDSNNWKHHYNYVVFVFISPKFLFPPEIVLKSFLEHKSCACVVCFARFALTQAGSSGTKREKPNLINKRTCSMIKIAASPGSTFHFPSSSYSQAKRAQLVQIDITVRNCKNQGCPQISEIYIIHSVASGVKEFHLNDEALLYV